MVQGYYFEVLQRILAVYQATLLKHTLAAMNTLFITFLVMPKLHTFTKGSL